MSQNKTAEINKLESYAANLFNEANAIESALEVEEEVSDLNNDIENNIEKVNRLAANLYNDMSDNDRVECLRELGLAVQRITQSKKNASEATLRARVLRDNANKLTAQRIAAHEKNQLSGRGEIYVFDNE
jgi:hypothetical protein